MTRSSLASLALLAFAAALLPTTTHAQGLLVNVSDSQSVRLPRIVARHHHPQPQPVPESSYRISELEIRARLENQVAQVQVAQTFVNTGSQQMEVCFIFPLPYDGAIDEMTLLVDGKEFPARLIDKDEARRQYEEIVRKNRDPALLEWMGTGMLRTSVFPVPPGAERTVVLTYSQLCPQDQGLTEFLFPLSTAKYTTEPVEKIDIEVTISSEQAIKSVYSPTHEVEVDRKGKRATVSYTAADEIPQSDLRVLFDAGDGKVTTSVVSYRPDGDEDGYFLLLATPEMAPQTEQQPPKTVMFVVDRSGSMSGEKIEQARNAARFVLNNLREGDLFNIIAYDSEVEALAPELQRYTKKTRREALAFIDGMYAGGSTNIDAALTAALEQLRDSDRPTYLLFLTDGLPTVGETNEMKIVEHAKAANDVRARVIAFGVGYDVNSRLLDKLARENFGQSQYVRPNEDIEARVSRLYSRIESPVMTDVRLTFELDARDDGRVVNRIYPSGTIDLFAGEQLVVVGRYKHAGAATVTVEGAVDGQTQSFEFNAKLVRESRDQRYAFIEKLWAMRRVGEIIDELDLRGHNDELVDELVKLSTRHGILTPYTSFLADENTDLADTRRNAAAATEELRDLQESSGLGAFAQRALKADLQQRSAPAASGPSVVLDTESDVQLQVDTVQNVGLKCFFFREQQWVDSTITPEMRSSAQRVEQFSDEYFKLAERYGRTLSQYLVFDEPVLVNCEGDAYLIEPSRK